MGHNAKNVMALTNFKHHRDMAWCCKANPKTNPPRLETKQGVLCPHISTTRVNTWLTTTNAHFRNTSSTENGTQKKPKKLEKSKLTQLV